MEQIRNQSPPIPPSSMLNMLWGGRVDVRKKVAFARDLVDGTAYLQHWIWGQGGEMCARSVSGGYFFSQTPDPELKVHSPCISTSWQAMTANQILRLHARSTYEPASTQRREDTPRKPDDVWTLPTWQSGSCFPSVSQWLWPPEWCKNETFLASPFENVAKQWELLLIYYKNV